MPNKLASSEASGTDCSLTACFFNGKLVRVVGSGGDNTPAIMYGTPCVDGGRTFSLSQKRDRLLGNHRTLLL